MIPRMDLVLDERQVTDLIAEILARRPGYLSQWKPSSKGVDQGIIQATTRYLQAVIQRLNRAPQKNLLAFLDMLGLDLVPSQSARVAVVFQLAEKAADMRLPARTRVASPPPPGRTSQIIFETEESSGLSSAKLKEVVSLWPGRDQYIDHSAAFAAGKSIRFFEMKTLEDTPHILYLAHSTILALAGKSVIDVNFELTTGGSETLDILWEYWDGKVWRQFLDMRPECGEDSSLYDSTNGLQRSGTYRLMTDCAETDKTNVNGVESFWIRGRLTEPLPPDPARILPEVDNIKLTAEFARPLKLALTLEGLSAQDINKEENIVEVVDEAETPLTGIRVIFDSTQDFTDENGEVLTGNSATVVLAGLKESVDFPVHDKKHRAKFSVSAQGLNPDKAFFDAIDIDVTKPFYPFGQQPQPGSAFYFTNDEVFSKPGASLQIYVEASSSAANQLNIPDTRIKTLPHNVSWEYWNGKDWVLLKSYSSPSTPLTGKTTSPYDFSGTEVIADLTVPKDMEPVEVNGQKKKWMRVRLLSGGFGLAGSIRNYPLLLPQPPLVAKLLLGYVWKYGPFHCERVFTYNDFQYLDRTDEAKWPGPRFQPFAVVSDLTPALYMGFDKKLPIDRIGIFLDVTETPGDTKGPSLLWDYWDGFNWQHLIVNDGSRNLRLPGIVSFIGAAESAVLTRFNQSLHWIRARLKDDGPPGDPIINGIFLNAVWADHGDTFTNQPLGVSNGQPNQVFTIPQVPVLEGEQIEIMELSGRRANTEWRYIVKELNPNNAAAIGDVEKKMANQGASDEIAFGDLRLVRNKRNEVSEVWVKWQAQKHLYFSNGDDRYYALDRRRGLLRFGDGDHGKVPPLGAQVRAAVYRTGGDLSGNVAAKAISQLLGPIGGIETVWNPKPAEGGANAESFDDFAVRAPESVRHRSRAVTVRDFEVLAKEANSAVAFARVVPGRNAAGVRTPGCVTLVIIPQSPEQRPWPSFGLREQVRQFLSARAFAGLSNNSEIEIIGPDYLPIDVEATIVPLNAAEAGAVEQRVRIALLTFLHPLLGGVMGKGWDVSSGLFLSDVAALLERIEGVDRVDQLALFAGGVLQGDRVKIGDGRIIAAGDIRLKLEA